MNRIHGFSACILVFSIYNLTFCSSNLQYNQIRIPLDNSTGVPFARKDNVIVVNGFEIDKEGNFYFLGGQLPTIACFSGNKQIYRKEYKEFRSASIYLIQNQLYLFDNKFVMNNLFVLNKSDGKLLNTFNKIYDSAINSFLFRDSSLILEILPKIGKTVTENQTEFKVFNLSGKYLKEADNRYNVSNTIYPKELENSTCEYLGSWVNSDVYFDYDVDTHQYIFTMRDKIGKIVKTRSFDETTFGKSFYENPLEHRKLRNENIYILGHDEKNVIITVLSLLEIFK